MPDLDPEPVHVRFESRYGWTVRRTIDGGPISAHATQSHAEHAGRVVARRERACLYVYSPRGTVIRSDSYVVER